MSKIATRYVEVAVTYDRPYAGNPFNILFRASIQEDMTPGQAEVAAIEEARAMHPDAVKIEEFMQRILTPEKEEQVRKLITNGTWDGWFEQ